MDVLVTVNLGRNDTRTYLCRPVEQPPLVTSTEEDLGRHSVERQMAAFQIELQ